MLSRPSGSISCGDTAYRIGINLPVFIGDGVMRSVQEIWELLHIFFGALSRNAESVPWSLALRKCKSIEKVFDFSGLDGR